METESYSIKIGILTVSDRCFRNESVDKSGRTLLELLLKENVFSNSVIVSNLVPDEKDAIKEVLEKWCDLANLDLILTTGGTGFSPRDVTPEATKMVIDKEALGMTSAMINNGLKYTQMAMLSRGIIGVRKNTLIINLPGSPKGCTENFEFLKTVIPHAIHQIKDQKTIVDDFHKKGLSKDSGDDLNHGCCKGKKGNKDSCNSSSTDLESTLSKVAFRNRSSKYPVIQVTEAQDIVLQHCLTMPIERKTLLDCFDHVAAIPMFSTIPLPPFPASIKDGYAVIAEDVTIIKEVIGAQTAGDCPDNFVVTPGQCVRVSTGGPVPKGADAVVQVEDTELVEASEDGKKELKVKFSGQAFPGQDIRPIGNDMKKDQLILKPGMKLRCAELGVLASAGYGELSVYRKPKIAVLTTGNELAEPGTTLNYGQIYDSNKVSLMALLLEHGYTSIDAGQALDNVEHTKGSLEFAFENADIVITSGGVSMGEKDILKNILEQEFGATIHFGRVFMKPGKPTTFATLTYKNSKKLVFALPGNPVSTVVTFYLFVLPALKKCSGQLSYNYATIKVELLETLKNQDPRPEYKRVILKWDQNKLMFTVDITGNQMSSRMLSMLDANGLLMVPPKGQDIPSNSVFDCIIIGQL